MLFITGNSRSGTTMMSRILGNNKAVFTFNELHFFEQLWMPVKDAPAMNVADATLLYSKLISLQRQGYLQQKNPELYSNEAAQNIAACNATLNQADVFKLFLLNESALHNKTIPCEQTPVNVFFISEITQVFPQAKIICMVRDPRDVLLSQKNKWKRRYLGARTIPFKETVRAWFNYHPFTISKLWNSSATQISKSLDQRNVYLIKFESLIENPEKEIKNLCSFLEIEFDTEMLNVPLKGSSTASDEAGKMGISKSNTAKFRNGLTDTEIFICQKITKVFNVKFGYADVKCNVNYFELLFHALSFPVKIVVSLLLNLKRTKNLIETIKRRF